MENTIKIYTDGGCRPGNPGPGGWAFLAVPYDGNIIEISGGVDYTTNNRMELTAVLKALEYFSESSVICIFSDSQYVCNIINEWMYKWAKKGWVTGIGFVKNDDLVKAIHSECRRHTVNAVWVRGHRDNAFNNRVDYLCGEEAKKAGRYVG